MAEEMILTTSNSIEGKEITSYLGIVSGESSLGTGFLSEFFAGTADFFGTESGAFSSKLGESKAKAINIMKQNAFRIGADAIIGIDIDVMITNANMVITCANGTAVCLKKKESLLGESVVTESNDQDVIIKEIAISNYCNKLNIRLSHVMFKRDSNSQEIYTTIIGKILNDISIEAICVDVHYITVFNEIIKFEDMKLRVEQIDNIINTVYIDNQNDINDILLIKDVKIYIKAIVNKGNCINYGSEYTYDDIKISNELLLENRKVFGYDYCGSVEVSNDSWKCLCGCLNSKSDVKCSACGKDINNLATDGDIEELYKKALTKNTAFEIYKVYKEYLESHTNPDLEEHIEKLHSIAEFERMYGNKKDKAIDYIEKNIR